MPMTHPEPTPAALDPAAAAVRPAPTPGAPAPESHFERELHELKRRLVREAVYAVQMLEAALWRLDRTAAKEIRRRDDTIDQEEVAIEQAALRVMALQHPYGRDFRVLAFVLKANADVERVADHATSIAKVVQRIDRDQPPQ